MIFRIISVVTVVSLAAAAAHSTAAAPKKIINAILIRSPSFTW